MIKCTGHGNRQYQNVDKFGFPKGKPKNKNLVVQGFRTGDMVKAVIEKGKYVGTYVGRVAVRAKGTFMLKTKQHQQRIDVSAKYCSKLHCTDGYSYSF
jgi:3-dehydroquinate synthase class II